ncbi:MAG: hypothetical protein JWO08_4523 [Verrucomicrobiaceae bacterium]|nr:hypothetical protein [Verrucomicrobiaceae bacterium]
MSYIHSKDKMNLTNNVLMNTIKSMKPAMNRLQTLLSMVKHITVRPSRGEEGEREPWKTSQVKMEQLELQFDTGISNRRMKVREDGFRG